MDFMSLRNKCTNDDYGRDFHRDHLPKLGDLTCLVCLIPDMYVEMQTPVLGPAVLHWGADVATDHVSFLEIQPCSDLQYV
jgi:hypothetical protein